MSSECVYIYPNTIKLHQTLFSTFRDKDLDRGILSQDYFMFIHSFISHSIDLIQMWN